MATWLGVCGENAVDKDTAGDDIGWWTNKIGGSADWICDVPDDAVLCPICRKVMALVMQLYAPLEDSSYHRTLYLLSCVAECRGRPGSWRVLRGQCVDHSLASAASNNSVEKASSDLPVDSSFGNDWCAGQDDWGEEDNDVALDLTAGLCPTSCAGQQVRSASSANTVSVPPNGTLVSPQKQVAPGNCPKTLAHFSSFYVDVVEESAGSWSTLGYQHELALLAEYEQAEGIDVKAFLSKSSAMAGASTGEQYEKEHAKHGDKAFEKFQKTLRRNPEQCVRYRWPLSAIEFSDLEPLPRDLHCQHCGSVLHAEVQLMPPLLAALCRAKTDAAAASCDHEMVDFGTVVVFSCSASCWADGGNVRHEHCVVLLDPDQEKLDKLPVR